MGKRRSIPISTAKNLLTAFAMTLITVENFLKLDSMKSTIVPYISIIATFLAVGISSYEDKDTKITNISKIAIFSLASLDMAESAGFSCICMPLIERTIYVSFFAHAVAGACALYIAYSCLKNQGGSSS